MFVLWFHAELRQTEDKSYSFLGFHRDFRQPGKKSRNQISNKIIGLSPIRRLNDGSNARSFIPEIQSKHLANEY